MKILNIEKATNKYACTNEQITSGPFERIKIEERKCLVIDEESITAKKVTKQNWIKIKYKIKGGTI